MISPYGNNADRPHSTAAGLSLLLLVVVLACPLLVFRGLRPFARGWVVGLLAILWCGLVVCAELSYPTDKSLSRLLPSLAPLFRRSLLLFPLTIVAFGIPLREQFWAGCNEGFLIGHALQPLWSDFLDSFSSRPLAELGVHAAFALSPSSLDGFLWLAVLLRFGTGLLAGDVLAECLPGVAVRQSVSCATAALFVVNPSEVSRFLGIGMVVYHVPVFAFVVAVWLYVKSYLLGRPSLLALSGLALSISALCYESVLPIAFFVPALLWLVGSRTDRWLWVAFWSGSWAVLAARFVTFVMTTVIAYQRYLVRPSSLKDAPVNLAFLARPTLSYLEQPPSAILSGVGVGSFVLAVLCVWLEEDQGAPGDGKRVLGRSLLASTGAIFLGLVPYTVLPMRLLRQVIQSLATLRTQYYAAPGQAAFYAVLLAMAVAALPNRWRRLFMAAATALLVAVAAGAAASAQRRPLREVPGGSFLGDGLETVARIFREVDRLAPNLDRNTSVYFVLGQGMRTPFGPDYDLLALSCARLGVPAYVGSYVRGRGWMPKRNFGSPEKDEVLGFKGEVRAFKLTSDGGVSIFVPKGDTTIPDEEVDPSVACETWTLPSALFGQAALTEPFVGSAPFDRGHQDFLRVALR